MRKISLTNNTHNSVEMQEPLLPGEGSYCQLLWEEKWSLSGLGRKFWTRIPE